MTDDTAAKIGYDILLKQFESLRDEAHQRLGYFVQIYQIYVVGLTAVYGYIIANKHWDILLLFPVISLSLYMRLIWDQKVLFFISDYTRAHLLPWFTEAVARADAASQRQWLIWDDYYPTAFATFPPFYKHSIFIIFGVISVIPSIAYCFYNLWAVHSGFALLTEISQLHLNTGLFQPAMFLSGVAFVGVFLWIVETTYVHGF